MKLTKHYEKTVLFLAVLTALGIGTSIGVNAGKPKRDFQSVSPSPAGVPVPGDEPRLAALGRELAPRPWINIFTGPTEYVIKGTGRVVDLSDPGSPPVHPPIPNRWWLQHRIDPGFADSPQRDADRDGFSNLEEFEAGSNPAIFSSHPPLIGKLRVAKLEELQILLTYFIDDCNAAPLATSRFGFRYADTSGADNRVTAEIRAGQGAASTFFTKPPAQRRFELKEVVRKGGVNTATVIDRRPNKDGREYEIMRGSKNGLHISDYTATLFVDALGQEGTLLEVEENGSFSLPLEVEAARKPYRFLGIRHGAKGPELVIESHEGGERKEYFLPAPGK